MSTDYKFNGKELDSETGMYYYGARYYTPELSIWLSVDPKSDNAPNFSPYSYCFHNPVKLIDPDGKWPWEAKNIRAARKEARQSGGEFERWRGQDGRNWASVDYAKSNSYSGDAASLVKVFRPEGRSWANKLGSGIKQMFSKIDGLGKGSDGGDRGGTMLSTKEKRVTQGPAITTTGDLGENIYTNVDNLGLVGPANISGGVLGLIQNVANGFLIGDAIVSSIQSQQKKTSNNSQGTFQIENNTGWWSHDTYFNSKDSALKHEKFNNNENIKRVIVHPKQE